MAKKEQAKKPTVKKETKPKIPQGYVKIKNLKTGKTFVVKKSYYDEFYAKVKHIVIEG